MRLPRVLPLLLAATTLPAQDLPEPFQEWWTWRGPFHTGEGVGDPPVEWSEEENVRWKTPLPGVGISTPIVRGDFLYLTSAVETDREGPKSAIDEQDHRAEPQPTVFWQFLLLCVDREDGSIVWQRTLREAVPHEGGHSTGSQASISPTTDGERLYVSFGSQGIYCLDFDGELLWEKDLGRMDTRRQYGEGSSPVVHGDDLILKWDHEGDSFLAVLDKLTGEERWRKDRDEVTSWSTPLVVEVGGKPQIVTNATTASRGYDLETGEEIWSLPGMTVNCIPSPFQRDGLVYLMSGYRGNMLQAVNLEGAKGDLSDSANVLWSRGNGTSYVPSALHYQGILYFLRGNNGVLNCVDAATGEAFFEGQRLPGIRSVYASPVAAAGRIYITSRDGVTVVLRAGNTYELLTTNRLDDAVDASLVPVDDVLYVRGRGFLYCLGEDD